MSRRSLFYLFTLAFLAIGVYLGLSQSSQEDYESRFQALEVPIQGAKSELSKDYRARGSFVGHEELTLNFTVAGRGQLRKRSGPVPEEDEVYLLIDEALHSDEAEDRAFAFSELGLLDPTAEILQTCFEGLHDVDEEVRVDAALALEMLEDPSAISLLQIIAETDSSEEVREAAAEAVEFLMNP